MATLKRWSCVLGLMACTAAAWAATPHVHSGPPPVKSGVAGFDIYRDGKTLHVLTAELDDTRRSRLLLYRQSHDDGRTWTRPLRVNGDNTSVHDVVRGNDPQLAAYGNTILAVWTAKGKGYGGSGPLVTAVSRDGGRTWHAGANPADDNSTAGHAYIDVIAGVEGFDLVWLDARDGAQGLRHAHSKDGASWSRNTTIQKATCECCWNTLARLDDALLVMLRGKGPRDMLLMARDRRGAWERSSTVGRFGWDFKGCPHTGGGLAWSGLATPMLHAVVWTGAPAAEGLHYLKSADRGRTWTAPHRVGSPDARRADITASGKAGVLVAWDQLEAAAAPEAAHRAVYVMASRDGGQLWLKPIRLSRSGADADYPRVAATDAGFLVVWTESVARAPPVLRMEPVGAAR